MKKHLVLLGCLFVACLSQAQITSTLFPTVPDSVRAWYLTNRVAVSGTANYQGQFLWGALGDTLTASPMITVSPNNPWQLLSGLTPNTTYRFAWSVKRGSAVDTSGFDTVTTPNLLPVSITNVVVTPGFPTLNRFHYSFIGGYSAYVLTWLNSYADTVQGIILKGSGDTLIKVYSPNLPNTSVNNNDFEVTVLGQVPIIPTTAFVSIPNYSVPNTILPTVTFSSPVDGWDSVAFSASITKGTASSGTFSGKLLDSVGNIVYTISNRTYTTDTNIVYLPQPLHTNWPYTLVVTNTTSVGSVIDSVTTRTKQVPFPGASSADTFLATLNSFYVKLVVNPNGSWSGNATLANAYWTDASGVRRVTSYSSWVTTPQTITLGPFTNVNPNPSSNTIVVYLTNAAGLIDSFTFTGLYARAPKPAVVPQTGWELWAISSFQLGIDHVNVTVPSNDVVDLYAFVNVDGAVQVDTPLLASGILSASNYLQIDTILNRVGNTFYDVRLATKNSDGVWGVNTNQLQQRTIAAIPPTFFIASSNLIPTNTTISYIINGCGNGTPNYMSVRLHKIGSSPLLSRSYGYQGTGTFEISDVITGLSSGTYYYLDVISVNQLGTDTVQQTYQFKTTGYPSGIDQVLSDGGVGVFPNPLTNTLHVVSDQRIGTTQLIDVAGQIVREVSTEEKELMIDVENLSPGIYFLKNNEYHTILTKK